VAVQVQRVGRETGSPSPSEIPVITTSSPRRRRLIQQTRLQRLCAYMSVLTRSTRALTSFDSAAMYLRLAAAFADSLALRG
jgi:hypothetical protein